MRHFPGGAVDKNLPSGTGGQGFNPWSGKISHAVGLLSPHATTAEAHVTGAFALQQEKPPQWEAQAPKWRIDLARHNEKKPAAQSNEDSVQSNN